MKKLIALLLVLTMALALVACGGSEAEAPAAEAPAAAPAAAADSAAGHRKGAQGHYLHQWHTHHPGICPHVQGPGRSLCGHLTGRHRRGAR